MSLRSLEALIGLVLLAFSIFQIAVNPKWWAYVPIYIVPAALAIVQKPHDATWRALSSISVVIGGLYTAFLQWTYNSIEGTPTLELNEAKNLPPLALGTLLISFIRLTQDHNTRPVHYFRSGIILGVAIISVNTLATTFQYLL